MSEVQSGLEGVVAFATTIAEPDREGGALRYRGVDLEELAGRQPFEHVWGLLVDGSLAPGLAPVAPRDLPLRTGPGRGATAGDARVRAPGGIAPSAWRPAAFRAGDTRADVQAAIAALGAELEPLIDSTDERARDDLAWISALTLDFVAQSARGADLPAVPMPDAGSLAERFLVRWRGEADPVHARAIDAYWVSAAEHGMNASTFTARVVASTGADAAAALSAGVGALSGPLHGGAPSRVLKMLDAVERTGDAAGWVRDALDAGERLMGFGHRIYRAEDPRARVLRRTARELQAPRFEAAEALEAAALSALAERRPDRVLATNVEFWSAVVLDCAAVPPELFTPLFACARTAGWSAHVLEQKREGRLIRPTALYTGEGPRALAAT